MKADEVTRYLRETFDGVRVAEGGGDTFLLYDPDGDLPPERQIPFATLVTGDHYDSVSDLDRRGAYRLNIGLTRSGYVALFGATPIRPGADGVFDTGFDYTATDTVLPHPTYAGQHWVCVVDPGEATWDTVRELLAEAYGFAVRKHVNRQTRQSAS